MFVFHQVNCILSIKVHGDISCELGLPIDFNDDVVFPWVQLNMDGCILITIKCISYKPLKNPGCLIQLHHYDPDQGVLVVGVWIMMMVPLNDIYVALCLIGYSQIHAFEPIIMGWKLQYSWCIDVVFVVFADTYLSEIRDEVVDVHPKYSIVF